MILQTSTLKLVFDYPAAHALVLYDDFSSLIGIKLFQDCNLSYSFVARAYSTDVARRFHVLSLYGACIEGGVLHSDITTEVCI